MTERVATTADAAQAAEQIRGGATLAAASKTLDVSYRSLQRALRQQFGAEGYATLMERPSSPRPDLLRSDDGKAEGQVGPRLKFTIDHAEWKVLACLVAFGFPRDAPNDDIQGLFRLFGVSETPLPHTVARVRGGRRITVTLGELIGLIVVWEQFTTRYDSQEISAVFAVSTPGSSDLTVWNNAWHSGADRLDRKLAGALTVLVPKVRAALK